MPNLYLSDRATAEAACERAAAARLVQLPVFRGAADRRHNFALLTDRAAPWPAKIGKCDFPTIALIGDDPWPAGASLGPEGWACARGARRWAESAICHGTGPHLQHYRLASLAAVLHRRLLMIETDSAHVEAWAAFFDCPVLRFVPPIGAVHPTPVAEIMQ